MDILRVATQAQQLCENVAYLADRARNEDRTGSRQAAFEQGVKVGEAAGYKVAKCDRDRLEDLEERISRHEERMVRGPAFRGAAVDLLSSSCAKDEAGRPAFEEVPTAPCRPGVTLGLVDEETVKRMLALLKRREEHSRQYPDRSGMVIQSTCKHLARSIQALFLEAE